MYNVLMEESNSSETSSYICGDIDHLFNLLIIFEKSEKVKEFKVFYDGIPVSWNDFSWGSFDKWVKKWSNQN